MVKRRPQSAVIIILQRDEAERLEDALRRLSHGIENFRHAVHWSRLGLKRNFDKVSLRQRARQL